MQTYNNDELFHHGVKGQRWGVRRYQNKDGSLTPAGKKRVEGSGSQQNQPTKKRKLSEISNDELKARTDRLNAENNYLAARERRKQLGPEPISKGKKFVKEVWERSVKPAMFDAGKQYLTGLMLDGLDQLTMKAISSSTGTDIPSSVKKRRNKRNNGVKISELVSDKPKEDK